MNSIDKKRPVSFALMCWLTILGNLLLLFINYIKGELLDIALGKDGIGPEAYIYLSVLVQAVLVTCLGAIVGAGLMLQGKQLGYTIYQISLAVHVLLVVCAMILWAMTLYFLFVSVLLGLYLSIPMVFWRYFRRNKVELV